MMYDPAFLRDFDALQPFRKPLRDVLLEESLFSDSGREAFHCYRTPNDVRQHQRRDHLVVACEFAFRDPILRKQDFFGMADHHFSQTTSCGKFHEDLRRWYRSM